MAKRKTVSDVRFRPKSEWQKEDCINDCGKQSTIEAILRHVAIRCCTDEKCKRVAAETAVISENAIMNA